MTGIISEDMKKNEENIQVNVNEDIEKLVQELEAQYAHIEKDQNGE